VGEPCDEIVLDTCVRYTGPAIPCLGIEANANLNLNQIIQIIANRLCDCCDGTPPVVDCQVSDWGPWGECINGVQTRTRTVIQSPQNGGAECPPLEETRECCLPVDCVVSEWSAWSECNGTTQTRTRTVVTPASCGGAECPVLEETRECCTPVDCVVSAWSDWSECVGGERTRTRTVVTPASCGGVECPVLSETEPCVIPCTQIENIFAESDNCETFFVSFTDDGSATTLSAELYEVSNPLVIISTKTWIPTGSLTSYSHTFTGLSAGTYAAKVYKNGGLICDVVITPQIDVLACVLACPTPTNLDVIEVCDHTNNGVTASATVSGLSAVNLSFELYNITAGTVLVDTQTASVPGGGSGSVNFFGLGLIAGDEYEVRVSTVCENFTSSAQVVFNFIKAACKPNLLDPCPQPTDLTATVTA
jgi:hypothetical protein